MEEGEILFWFVVHHAVVDGVSATIIQDELHALLLDRPLPPAADGIRLACRAERRHVTSPSAEHDRAYWRKSLDDLVADGRGEAFEDYATDRRRPEVPSGRSAPLLIERLEAATVASLTRIAQAHRTGLHGLLLTLLAAEIRRRSGRGDVIVGTGVSVRPMGAETAVGHFVNLLPLALRAGNAGPARLSGTLFARLAHGIDCPHIPDV